MKNGVRHKTEEGTPQGGNLSLLLVNIYFDKFDKESEGRGVKVIRYADDIVLFMIESPCTEPYARWCERSTAQLTGSLLPD